MINPGQQFRCYQTQDTYRSGDTGEIVNAHMSAIGNIDYTGRLAFNGKVFTCEEVKDNAFHGVVIVSGEYELRRDHFRFETIDATA